MPSLVPWFSHVRTIVGDSCIYSLVTRVISFAHVRDSLDMRLGKSVGVAVGQIIDIDEGFLIASWAKRTQMLSHLRN